MIEILTAILLCFAAPAAQNLRVRDASASLPDSGAVADSPDTSLHAVSRTPDQPPPRDDSSRAALPAPVVTLPPVRVDAALDRARRRAPTAFVTTLRADRADHAVASLPEALVEAAGLRITQYGGMGAFSSMSLRGAPPGHVTVLLDGVPLTSAAQGIVDLAGIPATAIEAVEVYRGAAPASFSSPTPGGAVNLLTRATGGVRSLRVASGSFGTGEAQGSWSESRGAWSWLAHGGWQGSDGDFEFADDNGTPLEPNDDTISRRRNARFDAATGLVRGAWAPGDHLQSVARVEYFRRGQGIPGVGANQAITARFASDRWLAASETRAAPSDAWPSVGLRMDAVRERSRLRDTSGELGFGRQDTDERFTQEAVSLVLASPSRWSWFTLESGGTLRAEGARPAAPTAGLASPPKSERDTRAAWIGARAGVADGRWLVTATRRWDRQDEAIHDTRSFGGTRSRFTDRTLNAPQLGARVRAGWGFALKSNWSRTSRAPDFDELFGVDGAVTGNPTLVPEYAESWDAGLDWSGTWVGLRVAAEWTHHRTHARDLILYERSSPRGARPVNVGAARLFGEETSLRASWRAFELTASTAWLSATDRSGISFYHGRRLPQRAERQSYARLAWRDRGWSATADVEYVGDMYLNRANFDRTSHDHTPPRTLIGAAVGRRFGRVTALVEGRNLGDHLTQDVAGFPLPGRMWLGSLSLDLGSSPP
jgi:iron complex outermembrane receptor protein